jgi:hypothetical protein
MLSPLRLTDLTLLMKRGKLSTSAQRWYSSDALPLTMMLRVVC